jgi:hypothetical protein
MKMGENSPEETLTMSPIDSSSIRTTVPSWSCTVAADGKHEFSLDALVATVVIVAVVLVGVVALATVLVEATVVLPALIIVVVAAMVVVALETSLVDSDGRMLV